MGPRSCGEADEMQMPCLLFGEMTNAESEGQRVESQRRSGGMHGADQTDPTDPPDQTARCSSRFGGMQSSASPSSAIAIKNRNVRHTSLARLVSFSTWSSMM